MMEITAPVLHTPTPGIHIPGMMAVPSLLSSAPATFHPVPMSCRDPGSMGGTAGATLVAAMQFFAAAQCLVHEPWPPQAELQNRTLFDFIIVGGGTAGATLAARLVEIPQVKVLLIEAGPDPPSDSIIPGFHKTLIGSAFDWNLTSHGEGDVSRALREQSASQPRGKMLGGSGSLNDMVYSRGNPADYDDWAETLGVDWKWRNVLPYFQKTEHCTDERFIDDPEIMKYHGRYGEIEVSGHNDTPFDIYQFLEAFKEVGFKIVKDLTNPKEIGVGRHSHTIRNGFRDSAVTALLDQAAAAKKDNLFVLKNSVVTKILISNKTAYGVKVLVGNDEVEYHFYAGKEVIVSAGVFHTPKLLMLSGVGLKEHLSDMGIEVVQESPVGENLHDHVMVLNFMSADNGTCYKDNKTIYMDMMQYLYDRSGPLSLSNSMAAYMALSSSPQRNVPDFALYPSCLPVGSSFFESCRNSLRLNDKICTKLDGVLKEKELLTVAVVLLKPTSRGRLKLSSADPLQEPLIYPGTFLNEEDLSGFPEAMRVVESIANSSYFKQKNAHVIDLEIDGCDRLEGDEKMKCDAKAMAMSAWHSVGTAAMGSVVDSRMEVLGMRDLRVVDASVMPSVVRGNTNAPVIMIAEKAADYIKAKHMML